MYERIFAGPPLEEREKVFFALKAEVDGVLSPTEVAAVRSKLGLSQRKASELLGGGPRAFQKYESGTQAVSTAMSHLLTLLANDPSRLTELMQMKSTSRLMPPSKGAARARKVMTLAFMLDTNAVSYALRGEGQVASHLRSHVPSELCVSAITVAELRYGADRRGSAKLHALIDAFVGAVSVQPFGAVEASRYGKLSAGLAAVGTPSGSLTP